MNDIEAKTTRAFLTAKITFVSRPFDFVLTTRHSQSHCAIGLNIGASPNQPLTSLYLSLLSLILSCSLFTVTVIIVVFIIMFHIVVVVHAVSHLCCVAFAFLFCYLCVLPMQLQLQHATCNMQLYLYPYLSVCTRQSSQQQPATQLCPKVPVLHCDDCAWHWHNLQQALQMPSVSAQASVAIARMCLD